MNHDHSHCDHDHAPASKPLALTWWQELLLGAAVIGAVLMLAYGWMATLEKL